MSRFQDLMGQALSHWLPNQRRFENYRPDWLFGMELDFYFPDLNMAVEVQGKQHYKFTPKFHKTRADGYAQRQRDSRKKNLCNERGVRILIARTGGGTCFCGMEQKLRDHLGISIPRVTQSMRQEWKIHLAILHKISVGEDVCRKEWKSSPKLMALLAKGYQA